MDKVAMNRLAPLTMPLSGLNLIEASAGTGKTYTITTLYLRLLLGLANPPAVDDGLSVDQILVVTFTEAATEEIRDRVRKRLSEARQAIFMRDVDNYKVDPVLSELISQLPEPDLAWKRLDAAIKMMDEAAIFTIHGFCQRMLKHHAFESGSLFDNEFILDEREFLEKSIKDFWRCTVYPLSGTMLSLFLQCWSSPKLLLAELQSLLNKHSYQVMPEISEALLKAQVDEYASLSGEVKSQWLQNGIAALINDSFLLKSRKPAKADYLEAFNHFCGSDELEFTKGKDSWELWSEESLTKASKKGKEPPVHPIFAQFSRLSELKAQIKTNVFAFYKQQAFAQVQHNLAAEKRLNQKISPDDLLTNLAKALSQEDKGKVLAQKIARQFPVAMIDEFQDTDPLQYNIFNSIYGQAGSVDNSETMIMIGDPKQAIYGFRGADIFTYIQAKTDVPSQSQYTLDTNWRSSTALIGAVNGLFEANDDPFIQQQIPFHPVKAADKADKTPLTIVGESSTAALKLWQLAPENDLPITKANAIATLAVRSANEIASLLNKAQNNQAFIGEQVLVASDICVLVRDRNEADSMRQALTSAGVSSVYLSRQSVFETPLAFEFYLLLQAIYEEKNERAIRAALITPFFNYSINQLWSLTQHEERWQEILDQFAQLHHIWLRNGVMAVLQHLLVRNDLASDWKQKQQTPERMLTDIRHIGELLQQKSMELDGVHRLLGWFHEQLVAAKDEGKVQQLRLEDDSNLVQIVTMHASKGLEYNIVFLPFVCGYRAAKSAIFHDETRGLIIDFANEEANLHKADRERLAEDLRLLYVALTRGVYRCYLGLFNLKVGNGKASHLQQTALGHLLFQSEPSINNAAITTRLNEVLSGLPVEATCHLEIIDDEIEPQSANQVLDALEVPVFKAFNGTIEYDWKVTSYSALANGVASVHVLPGGTDEGDTVSQIAEVVTDNEPSCFTFPKGSNPGSCLHEILENLDFVQFVAGQSDTKVIDEAFKAFAIEPHFNLVTEQWMVSVLNTPLNEAGLRLNQISNAQRLVEMEFYLPMQTIKAAQINQILSEHLQRPVSEFDFMPVQGILKGYIDLIIFWQGQYFVLDYKSNHLGMTFSDYTGESLEEAMSSHHYHLQYLLYSLALHRYLKQRLPDYDYDTHFGGNYYLFLRGMDQANEQFEGVYFSKPKGALIERLDRIFSHEGMAESAMSSTPVQLGLWGDE